MRGGRARKQKCPGNGTGLSGVEVWSANQRSNILDLFSAGRRPAVSIPSLSCARARARPRTRINTEIVEQSYSGLASLAEYSRHFARPHTHSAHRHASVGFSVLVVNARRPRAFRVERADTQYAFSPLSNRASAFDPAELNRPGLLIPTTAGEGGGEGGEEGEDAKSAPPLNSVVFRLANVAPNSARARLEINPIATRVSGFRARPPLFLYPRVARMCASARVPSIFLRFRAVCFCNQRFTRERYRARYYPTVGTRARVTREATWGNQYYSSQIRNGDNSLARDRELNYTGGIKGS